MTQNNGKVIDLETSEEISERTCLHMHNSLLYRVTYWETPGKERVVKFLSNYCHGAHVVIVLFDTTKRSSMEKAERMLKEISVCDIPFRFLIGNKTDLLETKKNLSDAAPQNDIEKISRMYKCEYFPCNASLLDAVNQIYQSQMNSIHNLVGDSMDLENLISKNIMIGKRVFSHDNFIKNMKASSYFDQKK